MSATQTQTIVLLGGGIDSIGIAGRCREMGLDLIIVDQDPEAPARPLAAHFVKASCYHVDPVLSALRDLRIEIHGVLCAGVDAPHVMAAVAAVYGLVGPEPETASTGRDKWLQYQALNDAGIRVPNTYELDWVGMPIVASHDTVIKPTMLRGARGVRLVRRGYQITEDDFHYPISTWGPSAGIIIGQDWIDGQQISSESLVQNGEILWTAFADRNYDRLEEFAPYVIEDGCDMPSAIIANHENDWRQKAHEQLWKCKDALGLRNGVLKGDLVWDGQRIWVIEVATRLSGGRMCSDITPEVWGVDFVGMAVRIALGDHIWPGEINPYLRRHCSQRFQFPVKPQAHPDRGPHMIGYGTSREEAQAHAAEQLNRLKVPA